MFDKSSEVNSLMCTVVPEATYKRRTRLTPTESERTERLARVIAMAEHVLNGAARAQKWLRKPHVELNGKSPIAAAMTEIGTRQVEGILDAIFYDLPV